MSARAAPRILALDFDGVLCDGRPEYYESSCRAYGHFWSPSTLRGRALERPFRELRPVVKSGWEMPLLVRALVTGAGRRTMLRAWPTVREKLLASFDVARDDVVGRLRDALDAVRRDWIWAGADEWLAAHRPYVPLDVLGRVVGEPERTFVVTTKEGELARRILAHWGISVAGVAGKEAGEHKCDNLRELMTAHGTTSVWFVEDRVETLECVVECSRRDPRLADVRLFLAAWGYTTSVARATARRHPRIRLLTLAAFRHGVAAWDGGPRHGPRFMQRRGLRPPRTPPALTLGSAPAKP